MKIWFSARTDKLPEINLEAESASEYPVLAGFKAQIDKLRSAAIYEGLVGDSGPSVATILDSTGNITKITIPLLVGFIDIVYKNKFPPDREDRTQVRLIAKRVPGGRRLSI